MSVPSRNNGLDALRAAVTLLVVFHHTAITYGASGGWFYREVPMSDQWQSLLLTLFAAINQAWFMGLFFLLAGYHTPEALERKGTKAFLRDRALRLGLPLLAFGLVLGPFTEALARLPRQPDLLTAMGQVFASWRFVYGPLWFVWALLLFSLAAAVVRAGFGAISRSDARFPSYGMLALAAVATGLAAFALRLVWPVGVNVSGLQLGYFASYIVLFIAGCLAAKARLLDGIPPAAARFWGRIAAPTVPLLLVAAVFKLPGAAEGGANPLALLYALWEPFVATGVILMLLVLFQRRFAAPSPVMQALIRRAYTIFIIHAPVLVAVALLGRGIAAPPLVKFLVTGSLACVICFALAGPLVKAPGLRRIL